MWLNIEKISHKRLSLLIAGGLLLGVMLFFLPVMLVSIEQLVDQGEKQYAQFEVGRVERIIQNEKDRLDQTLSDWAYWDDTYQFAQDANQEYLVANLADSSLINLDIDIFLVLNSSREIVYAKYVDRIDQVEAPPPFDLQSFLIRYPAFLSFTGLDSTNTGLALTADQPLMVAARQILTSNREGPPGGVLLFIRLLDEKELAEYSELAQRKVELFPLAAINRTVAPGLPAPQSLADQIFVFARDERIVEGYRYLVDINGQPDFLLQVDNPRDLHQLGRKTAHLFSLTLLLLSVLLAITAYFFARAYFRSQEHGRKYLRRFEAVIHQSSDAILLVASDCHILDANPASKALLDWPLDLKTEPCLQSLLTFTPDFNEEYIQDLCRSGNVSEHHCRRHDGEELDIELSASLIVNGAGRAYSLIMRNVTGRKKTENALKASEERYSLTSSGANDGLWDWNLMKGEIYLSARWKSMLGYAEDEIGPIPEEWFDRVHPDDLLLLKTQLNSHIRKQSDHFECEYRIRQRNGEYHWMLARGAAVWDAAGYAHRIAGSQTDIENRKRIEEQLRYDALHDALTGLGNRTLLIDRLRHVNERKRRKPELPYALFFLDLDKFKQINDSFGHRAGDQVLIEVSHRLGLGLRATDTVSRFNGLNTVARIAGDEFVILLEDFCDEEDVQKVGDRIAGLLNAPFLIDGQEILVSASMGVAVPEEPYDNPEDIIRDADIAMYRAKQLGGARMVKFSSEMYQGTIQRIQLENDLRKAVERNEFEVHYQPIFTLGDHRLTGLEALVRWNHPQKGLLLPEEFIKVADEIGVIIPIGYFVIEEACRKVKSWQESYNFEPEIIVSLNLTPRQLMHDDLVERVAAITQKIGVKPMQLWFEVTESVLLENNKQVLARLNEIKRLGIHIEIDDFGTGYSSLSYLQNLPIDGFKIDRSFIKDIQIGGTHIIKSLVELGHSMGMTEVAEGVETEFQMEFLKSIDCDYVQGYLLARPLSPVVVEQWLRQNPRPAGLPIETGEAL